MPENGPSGSEGGVARKRHPYPYRNEPERRVYAAESAKTA